MYLICSPAVHDDSIKLEATGRRLESTRKKILTKVISIEIGQRDQLSIKALETMLVTKIKIEGRQHEQSYWRVGSDLVGSTAKPNRKHILGIKVPKKD